MFLIQQWPNKDNFLTVDFANFSIKTICGYSPEVLLQGASNEHQHVFMVN